MLSLIAMLALPALAQDAPSAPDDAPADDAPPPVGAEDIKDPFEKEEKDELPHHKVRLHLGGAGGYDYGLDTKWAGVAINMHAAHTRPLTVSGNLRIFGGYSFADKGPVVFMEGGPSLVIPQRQATLRVALEGRLTTAYVNYKMGLDPTPPEDLVGQYHVGFLAGGMASVEFEWGRLSRFTLGFRGGLAQTINHIGCLDNGSDPNTCMKYVSGFVGGATIRYRHKSGFSIEGQGGTVIYGSVGYAF